MRVRVKWNLTNCKWSVCDCEGVTPPYHTDSIVLLNCKLHHPFGHIEGDVSTGSTRYQSECITPIGFVNDKNEIRFDAECVFLTSYEGSPSAYASVTEDA